MWTIKPLNLATMHITNVAAISKLIYTADPGKRRKVPDYAWLLRNRSTDQVILVDTGPGKPEIMNLYHSPIEKTQRQELKEVLANEGLKLSDIKTVILTHLHWDHAYGACDLTNAEVYVQEKEIQYAVNPFTVHKSAYELNNKTQAPFFMDFYHRMKIINGDMDFCDGIKIIALPGHSPGSQGVLVEGEDSKRYLITGDLYYDYSNYAEDLPTGVYTSLYDYYDSFDKVKGLGKDLILLPSHDENIPSIIDC